MTEHQTPPADQACYDEVMASGVPVVTGHDLTISQIIAALCRLPEDVRRWALDECWFTSVGLDAHARAIPSAAISQFRNRGLVILRDVTAADLGEEAQSTIAHEIAHVRLGHRLTGETSDEEVETQEREAHALAREWGFTGRGAEVARRLPEKDVSK